MNDNTSRGPGPRSPGHRRARVAAVMAVMAVMAAAALLAAACGGSPPAARSGGAPIPGSSAVAAQAVRFTNCMRSHSVPDYPYPNSAGQLPKIVPGNVTQFGVSWSRFNAAYTSCEHLWPYQGLTQAQTRQELTYAVTVARCMRSHGVPNWPDPTTNPDSGIVEFVIHPSQVGFNPQSPSPRILAVARECERGLPAYVLPGSPNGVQVTTAP